MVEPLYTAATCKVAYQLDWAYCAFWHRLPSDDSWFEQLKTLNETDHIRLLQHRFDKRDVSKFLVSTQPQVPPLLVAQRVKGRLQWLIRARLPDPEAIVQRHAPHRDELGGGVSWRVGVAWVVQRHALHRGKLGGGGTWN